MNSTYVEESRELSSSGAWVWLLELSLTGYSTLRYVCNNEDVVWGGNTYSRMPFSMDDVEVSTSGKFPEFRLVVGDVDTAGSLRTTVAATTGMVGGTARLMIIHTDHLILSTAAVDESAEILDCTVTAQAVAFTLGFPSLLGKRFPRDRYLPGFCRHKFRGALCKYAGTETTCNHTLDNCRERNNSTNYGGSQGVVGGIYA